VSAAVDFDATVERLALSVFADKIILRWGATGWPIGCCAWLRSCTCNPGS
jgi:hypothetical protein